MTDLTHVETHVSKKKEYSGNITDLVLIDSVQGTLLVAISNKGAGLTCYMLTGADTPARGTSREAPISYGTYYAPPAMEVIERGPNDYRIVITGQQGSVYTSLEMAADGNLKSFTPLFAASAIPGDIVAMNIFAIGGQDYVLAGRDGNMSLQLYRLGADLSLSALGAASPGVPTPFDSEYTDIEVLQIGSRTFAFGASARGNLLSVYEVGAGGIKALSVIDGNNEIGISAPREVQAVSTATGRFLIVTGGESDSLTVFKITNAGGLQLTDHVIDSGSTRFQAVTAIATVEVGGRAYVIVGGADDGISILTLDGQGRLILLEVLADTNAMALADVSAIEATLVDGKIVIFVTSATEIGITQLSFDPGNIGATWVGTGRLEGTAADDILVGTGASSVLTGGAGDDILIGREGNVLMRGGAGRDTFVPGYGTEMVTIYDFNPATDRLDLSELAFIRSIAQLKVIPTATGALLIAGEVRIDIRTDTGTTLPASAFTEAMFRLAHYANDIDFSKLVTPPVPLSPGTPSNPDAAPGGKGGYVGPAPLPAMLPVTNPVYGGVTGDRVFLPAAGGTVFGRAGNDTLVAAKGARNNLLGESGDDFLFGGNLSDFLNGGEGNDLLDGGAGNDRLYGGNGNDTIRGGAGSDWIYGEGGRDILIGQDGNDMIFAGSGGNHMIGGAGHDMIRGVLGFDTIVGDTGNDRLFSAGNYNRIWGGPGNDYILATGTGNIMIGDAGNDTIRGGWGRDFLYGGEGNDLVMGGAGDDFIIAHNGDDTMMGQGGNDHLIGNDGNDKLYGGPGNDILWGVDGDDLVRGQNGNDSIRGGPGNDRLYGGNGNDKMIGGTDDDLLRGDGGNDLMLAEGGHDSLYGGSGDDSMFGESGRDYLDGGAGNDYVHGGSSHDVLLGGAGNDRLIGGGGNDTLTGGTGNDTLIGRTGEDVFIFTRPAAGTKEYDEIRDYDSDEDVIDLSGIANGLVWLGSATLTGQGRPEVAIDESGKGTRLIIDIDGDGKGDLFITILGDPIDPFDMIF